MRASPTDFLLKYFPEKLVGAGFMLAWAVSFSSAMACAKSLDPCIHSFVLFFMKSLFGLVFFSPFFIKMGAEVLKTNKLSLQILRGIFISISSACTYYTYRHLPLGLATSIGMTGPLFTTVLSILILRDRVSFQKWMLIILGYIGVIIVIRPHEVVIEAGILTALFANLFAASSIVTVKMLARTESTLSIMAYANLATTALGAGAAFFVWDSIPNVKDILILIIVGGLAIFSQFCSVTALRYANPSFLAPFEYTRLCFAITIGFLVFGETPSFWVLLGSGVIIVATYLITQLELDTPDKKS